MFVLVRRRERARVREMSKLKKKRTLGPTVWVCGRIVGARAREKPSQKPNGDKYTDIHRIENEN